MRRLVLPVLTAMLTFLSGGALAEPLTLKVASATLERDAVSGEPVIRIVFDAASREAFAALTRENVGKVVLLRIDGEEVMRPVVREPIAGGTVQISGDIEEAEGERIAARLAAGSAKVEVEVLAE